MTQKRANLLLATVAATWGTSYIFMKLGLECSARHDNRLGRGIGARHSLLRILLRRAARRSKIHHPGSGRILFALETVSTALLALVFLHENIGLQGYSGAALILCGVILANRKKSGSRWRIWRLLPMYLHSS